MKKAIFIIMKEFSTSDIDGCNVLQRCKALDDNTLQSLINDTKEAKEDLEFFLQEIENIKEFKH